MVAGLRLSLKKTVFPLLGVVVLLSAVAAFVLVSKGPQFFGIGAKPDYEPKNVKLTNLTENSVTVSWITSGKSLATVVYGLDPNKLESVGVDDKTTTLGNVHHVTLAPLTPGKKYYYVIVSGTGRYLNRGKPFEILVPLTLGRTPPAPRTVYGSILGEDGNTYRRRAIVYIEIPGANPVSALANENGNWAVSVSTSRINDLSDYVDLSNDDELRILIETGGQEIATGKIHLGDINMAQVMRLSD